MSTLLLEVTEGPDAGRRVTVDRVVEIGRDPANTLVLQDRLVSRHHCRLTPGAGAVTIEDLHSSNGTIVNGTEITVPIPVGVGDEIVVGTTVLLARAEAQSHESAVRAVPPPLAQSAKRPAYVPAVLGQRQIEELAPLLDSRVRSRTRLAPLALIGLAAIALVLFFALR